MKGFSVAEARARFGDLLDSAEQGEQVVIERHGIRFVLQAETASTTRDARPMLEWIDPAVEAGEWTWDMTDRGTTFKPRRTRKQR
jgi:antitoxin (DNA-binding transcriptional repressor) of toxin-antitoxin stability system